MAEFESRDLWGNAKNFFKSMAAAGYGNYDLYNAGSDRPTSSSPASSAYGDYLDRVQTIIENATNAYATSAIRAQMQEAKDVRRFNSLEAAINRQFNASEAQKARDWQERMDKTAYQRLVDDMRKAGLNPILAYESARPTTGSAASASGSAASGVQANISSAKSADKLDLDDLLPVFVFPLISSALQLIDKYL